MPSYNQYKRQVAVLDADNSEIESWITVRGNHIPIKKGQSKEEAVKSFIESKGGEYKKESYGKHYVKYGEGENKRYASPRNDLIYSEKSRAGFFGSKKEAKEYAKKLNHTDPYAGTEFAMKNYKRTVLPYEVESEEEKPKEFATKYLKRARNGVGKEKWEKMSYAERAEAIKKEKDYYRTEGRNLYFDTNKGYGIRTDDPDFEKQFFEEYSDADKEDFKDYVKGFNGVGVTNEGNSAKSESKPKSSKKWSGWGMNKNKQVFSIKGGRVVVDPKLKTANWYNSQGALTLKQKDLDVDKFVEHGVNNLGWKKMSGKEESALKEFQKIANKPEYKGEEKAEAGFVPAPKVKRVDKKAWNSPATDPWKSLYDNDDVKKRWSADWKKK